MASTGGTDIKSAVIAATSIVDVIGQSVSLRRRGKDYVGLCPFHNEKTPSFHVSPERGYFKCYGCKEGGNVIDFVMKRDRIEFIEALKQLAQAAGIDMPRHGMSKEKSSERAALIDAHAAARTVFEQHLAHPQIGAAARQYIEKRGLTAETVRQFGIGFAPDGWDNLLRHQAMRKYPPPLLALGGLLKQRTQGDGFYDTFRNRLMFPIRDETGRTIAFGGRVMPGSEDPAKYLNSPETPLFSKSRSVFGLDLGRKRIVETRTVAVVEGYTDVVMAHQYGVSNVVSILGTALTEGHLTILRRFADRVVLLFDADTAGDTAVNRAVELFLSQPVEIAIASLPEPLDPDEYLMKHGAQGFEAVINSAADALTFKWKLLDRQFRDGSDSLTAQQKAVDEYLKVIAGARGSGPVDELRFGAALRRVERLTGIPVEDIRKRLGGIPAPRGSAGPRGSAKTRSAFQPGSPPPTGPGVANAQGGQAGEPKQEAPRRRGPVTARDRAENIILGTVLARSDLWEKVQQHVDVNDFTDTDRRALAELVWDQMRHEGELVFADFIGGLDSRQSDLAIDLVEAADSLGAGNAPVGGAQNTMLASLESAVLHLKEDRRRREEQNLLAQLRRMKGATAGDAEVAGDGRPAQAGDSHDTDGLTAEGSSAGRVATGRQPASRQTGDGQTGDRQPADRPASDRQASDRPSGGSGSEEGSAPADTTPAKPGRPGQASAEDEIALLRKIEQAARHEDLRRGVG